jgi:signal-transduction protein with cAMP-binding, CBS, and nucleotidyltransferase domain
MRLELETVRRAGLSEFSILNLFTKRRIVAKKLMEIVGSVGSILANKISVVWSIAPNSMVFDAIQLMADKNVGALPVVDNGQLVGMISERDYTRKVILKGKSSKDTPVREIMTQELVTVNTADSVSDCMRVMTDRRIRHLPVMEEKRMVGLVSIGDLVKWIISAQTATIDALEKYITGDYPA